MNLGELIEFLSKQDPNIVAPVGLGEPHSSRGDYADLEFTPVANVTVGQMLDIAKSCVGQTFGGYKGGDYTMDENSSVYIGQWGEWEWPNEAPGPVLLSYMVGKPMLPSNR